MTTGRDWSGTAASRGMGTSRTVATARSWEKPAGRRPGLRGARTRPHLFPTPGLQGLSSRLWLEPGRVTFISRTIFTLLEDSASLPVLMISSGCTVGHLAQQGGLGGFRKGPWGGHRLPGLGRTRPRLHLLWPTVSQDTSPSSLPAQHFRLLPLLPNPPCSTVFSSNVPLPRRRSPDVCRVLATRWREGRLSGTRFLPSA